MADEKVTIKLEVNADTRGANKVQRELRKIAAQAAAMNSASGMRSSTAALEDGLQQQNIKWKKHFDEIDKLTKGFGKMMAASMKLATKAVVAELALLSISLVGVHAVFAAGQGIMKAYRWALEATGAAAAAMGIAITTAAAAIREQQAAMYAYKTTALGEFGSGLNQTRVLMRGLTMDSQMAFIGVENLNKAFAAVSKTSTWNSGSQSLLRGLMDFAAAGQPIEQGVEKAGELIAALQETKTSWSEIKRAAEASSPAMKKALEEAEKQGINSRDAFIKALNSGQLAQLGGVSGQFDAVSGTLINRIKQNFNILRGQFADAGQQFLLPVKDSLDEIFRIFQRAFTKTIPVLSQKGLSSFTDGIITVAEKLESLYTKVIFDYAKRTEGIFENISKWWNRFRAGWEDVANALRPLIDGARVIEEAFMAAMQPIKDAVSNKFGSFNQWLQENRSEVVEFGDNVGKLVASIMRAIGKLGDLYKTLLPFINRVITGLTQVTDLLGDVLGMFGGMGEAGSMFALMGMRQLAGGMAGFKGGQIAVMGRGPGGGGGYGYGDDLATRLYGMGGGIPYGSNFDDDLDGGMRSRTGGGGMRTTTGPFDDADDLTTPSPEPTRRRRRFGRGDRGDRGPSRMDRWFHYQTGQMSPEEEAEYLASRGRVRKYLGRKMQDFSNPMTEAELRELDMRNKQPGMIGGGKLAQALRRQRARNVGLNRFQQSGTAKVGVGVGLGMLSSVAPAEMQGALALGGMAAQINPMLGLAVGGLGAAFSAQGAGTGALAGMAGGGAIGAMVGGPVGAIIGAALGGVAGAIRGWSNKAKKQADEARKSVQDVLNRTTAGIVQSTITNLAASGGRMGAAPIKTGLMQVGAGARATLRAIEKDMADYRYFESQSGGERTRRGTARAIGNVMSIINGINASRGITLTEEERKRQRDNPYEWMDETEKTQKALIEASDFMNNMFIKRMEELTNVTGMGEAQVLALAKSLGVDLMDPMKTTIELTKELGHLQLRNAEQISMAYSTLASDIQGLFKKTRAAVEAPLVADEATRSISDLIERGGAKDTDILSYLEQLIPTMLSAYGDNAGGAMVQFMTSFGTAGRTGTAFTDPNSPLYGMQDAFNTEVVGGALSEAMDMMIENTSAQLVQDINANLRENGQILSDSSVIESLVRDAAVNNPELIADFVAAQSNNFAGYGGDIASFFANQGIQFSTMQLADLTDVPSQFTLSEEAKTQVQELSKQFGAIFEKYSEKPEWMTAAFIRNAADNLDGGADTSTPRGGRIGDTTSSRLATTMNRHSVMDSMLTGKRTITSAWRNTNLGSMNSDHVTGRAYDLIGQNLGQYQKLVNSTGGFAEFHGVNGTRHLHVVPGPVGDTAVPAMTAPSPSMRSGGNAVTNNYSINVSTNASDPEAVATFVMRKIEEVNRDKRERR